MRYGASHDNRTIRGLHNVTFCALSVTDAVRDLDPQECSVDDMPFHLETRPVGQPHPDDVDDVVRSIRSWSCVTPDQRVALRAAVARLTVTEFVPAAPIERPMRVAEVAGALRVSRQKVRDMIRAGDLPAYRLSSNPRAEFRVPESAVRDFLARAS